MNINPGALPIIALFLFALVAGVFTAGLSVGAREERGKACKPAQLPSGKIWRCLDGFTGPNLVILSNIQNQKEYFLVELDSNFILDPRKAYKVQNDGLVVFDIIESVRSASLPA